MKTKKIRRAIFLVAMAIAVPAITSHAQETSSQQAAGATSQTGETARPNPEESERAQSSQATLGSFQPPLRGAPGGRVGGGSRGPQNAAAVYALAPNQIGFTSLEQPVLYWFATTVPAHPLEFSLVDLRTGLPVVEIALTNPERPGLQRVRLAEHGVRLAPGVPYRWFVALVIDPDRRSKDVLIGGTIERRAPADELQGPIAETPDAERPAFYVARGLWYDAITTVIELVEATPRDRSLLRARSAILVNSGLPNLPE